MDIMEYMDTAAKYDGIGPESIDVASDTPLGRIPVVPASISLVGYGETMNIAPILLTYDYPTLLRTFLMRNVSDETSLDEEYTDLSLNITERAQVESLHRAGVQDIDESDDPFVLQAGHSWFYIRRLLTDLMRYGLLHMSQSTYQRVDNTIVLHRRQLFEFLCWYRDMLVKNGKEEVRQVSDTIPAFFQPSRMDILERDLAMFVERYDVICDEMSRLSEKIQDEWCR